MTLLPSLRCRAIWILKRRGRARSCRLCALRADFDPNYRGPGLLGFFGGRSPDELSQSSRLAASPTCRALLMAASRSGPLGRISASSRSLWVCSRRRSLRGLDCLMRCRLIITERSFPLEGSGSATGVLADKSRVPGCGAQRTLSSDTGSYQVEAAYFSWNARDLKAVCPGLGAS